jgi:hypothetical protein
MGRTCSTREINEKHKVLREHGKITYIYTIVYPKVSGLSHTRWEATQRVVAAKLTRLTHKIATQLHLVAESCTICTSRSRRPVRKLLDTPSYVTENEREVNWIQTTQDRVQWRNFVNKAMNIWIPYKQRISFLVEYQLSKQDHVPWC